MKEPVSILLLSAGPLLWMVGGTYWRPFRWALWPLTATTALLLHHSPVFPTLLMGTTMALVNTFPYGDHTRWPVRLLVFASYGAPIWFLWHGGIWLSLILSAGVLTLFFLLSRAINRFQWKIWEAMAGLLQAAMVIMAAGK